MSLQAIRFQPSAQERRQATAADDKMADGVAFANRRTIGQARRVQLIRTRLETQYGSGPGAAQVGLELARSQNVRRAMARRIGLAYWPALLEDVGCDPFAFVAAERVLARKSGGYWGERLPKDLLLATGVAHSYDGNMPLNCNGDPVSRRDAMHHGGWDSQGHYGPHAGKVAKFWFAAGCRDSDKFRLQVSTGIEVKKGDSLPFARNFVRGLRWVQARRGRFADAHGEWQDVYFSRKALAALGRLSPEARAAATRGLAEQAGEGKDGEKHQLCVCAPVRVADLNWREVRRYTDALRAAEPPDAKLQVQIAYAGGPRRAREYGANSVGLEHYELPVFLVPALPNLELPVAQALARGMSQEQINRAVRPDSRRTVIAPPAEHGIETPLLAGDFFGHQSRDTIRRFGPLWEGGNIVGFRSTGVAMRFPSPTQFGYYWEHGVDAAACAAEYQHKVLVQAGREAQAKQSARDARAVRLMRRLCKKAVITRFAVRTSGACQAGIESWLQANGWPASQDKLTIGQLPPVRDWPGYLADGVSVELAALRAARR